MFFYKISLPIEIELHVSHFLCYGNMDYVLMLISCLPAIAVVTYIVTVNGYITWKCYALISSRMVLLYHVCNPFKLNIWNYTNLRLWRHGSVAKWGIHICHYLHTIGETKRDSMDCYCLGSIRWCGIGYFWGVVLNKIHTTYFSFTDLRKLFESW
jgi:hypothetical protein